MIQGIKLRKSKGGGSSQESALGGGGQARGRGKQTIQDHANQKKKNKDIGRPGTVDSPCKES